MLHNFIIGMLMTFYMVIAISSGISFHSLEFRPFGNTAQSVTSILMFAAIVLMPVGLFVYSWRNWNELSSASGKEYIGTFF